MKSYKHYLILLFISLFAGNLYAQEPERRDSSFSFRGNKFEVFVNDHNVDTVENETKMFVFSYEYTNYFKLNGRRIYDFRAVEVPAKCLKDTDIFVAVFKKMLPDVQQLPDGRYAIRGDEIIVDQLGNVVFINFPRLISRDDPSTLTSAQEAKFDSLTSLHFYSIKLSPAKVRGQAVPSRIGNPYRYDHLDFTIKNHKAAVTQIGRSDRDILE